MKEFKFKNKYHRKVTTVVCAGNLKDAEVILNRIVSHPTHWTFTEPKPGRRIVDTSTSSTIRIS